MSTEWQPWCHSRLSTHERGWPCMFRFVRRKKYVSTTMWCRWNVPSRMRLLHLAMRAREAARVRDHADLAGLPRRRQHVLGVGQVQAHRNLDLDVLALRERQDRLVVVLVARRRQDHRVHAGPIDARLEAGRSERDSPFRRECLPALFGAARDRRRLRRPQSSAAPSRESRPSRRFPPDKSSFESLRLPRTFGPLGPLGRSIRRPTASGS